MRRAAALALVLAVLASGPALAHRLKVFATTEGAAISGTVYFPGGGRAAGQTVRVVGPDGRELGAVVTDAEGAFSFRATARVDHRFVARTADGHRAEFLVPAEQLPPALPAPEGARAGASDAPAPPPAPPAPAVDPAALEEVVARAVAREVNPLHRRIEGLEDHLRLRDILGGIGWILGLAGVAFFLLGKRRGG